MTTDADRLAEIRKTLSVGVSPWDAEWLLARLDAREKDVQDIAVFLDLERGVPVVTMLDEISKREQLAGEAQRYRERAEMAERELLAMQARIANLHDWMQLASTVFRAIAPEIEPE